MMRTERRVAEFHTRPCGIPDTVACISKVASARVKLDAIIWFVGMHRTNYEQAEIKSLGSGGIQDRASSPATRQSDRAFRRLKSAERIDVMTSIVPNEGSGHRREEDVA